MIKEKECSTCKITKSIEEFGKRNNSLDGYRGQCKECWSKPSEIDYETRLKEREELKKEGKRRCTNCQNIKSLDDFYTRNGVGFDGKSVQCSECSAIRKRKDHWKGYLIKEKQFNQSDLENLYEKQNCKCGICKKDININPGNKDFAVDHDHDTMQVRGLLCMKCNRGLGLFNDNTDLLQAAIKYLK